MECSRLEIKVFDLKAMKKLSQLNEINFSRACSRLEIVNGSNEMDPNESNV